MSTPDRLRQLLLADAIRDVEEAARTLRQRREYLQNLLDETRQQDETRLVPPIRQLRLLDRN